MVENQTVMTKKMKMKNLFTIILLIFITNTCLAQLNKEYDILYQF